MSVAYLVVTVFAAVFVGFSGVCTLVRAPWVVKPMGQYQVPESWWPWLGTAKLAGSLGLLAGLAIPALALAAAIALTLYFIGAVITVLRVHLYTHIPAPLVYLAPVIASIALKLG